MFDNFTVFRCPFKKPGSYNLTVIILFISRYRIIRDPAGWLNVDQGTGLIKVKSVMDRESTFVSDNKYTALIGAYDDGRLETGPVLVMLILFSALLYNQKRDQNMDSFSVFSFYLTVVYCFPNVCLFVHICHLSR